MSSICARRASSGRDWREQQRLIGVWSSAETLAATSPAMVLVALARFSTNTGWFRLCCSFPASMRAQMSVPPAGEALSVILSSLAAKAAAVAGVIGTGLMAAAPGVSVCAWIATPRLMPVCRRLSRPAADADADAEKIVKRRYLGGFIWCRPVRPALGQSPDLLAATQLKKPHSLLKK